MMKRIAMLILVAGLAAAPAGCSTTQKTIGGAALGGVGGAVVGDAIAGTGGAVVGGVGGAVAGAAIARRL
ncbi:MAG TPA: hypothetical protein VFT89_08350 [Rhizobiaceae bacterium]|nr:hypothetical protein [Rhizobiaceae bacterium]